MTSSDAPLPARYHETRVEVRYSETDQMGFAHHSTAVKWFEMGRIAWLLNGRARRVTEENIALCFPQMSAGDRLGLARKSLQHSGMLAMESGYVWRRPLPQLFARMTQVEGLEHFEAARAAGRGVLVLGPHLGNWEILGFYLQSLGQITFMYQPPESPAFDQLIRQARCRNRSSVPHQRTAQGDQR